MNLEQAEELYGRYFQGGEKVRAENLSKYNYRFTARFVNIGSQYKLFELLPLTSDQPADYCFLTMDKIRGVIIPDPFHEHKAKLMGLPASHQLPRHNYRGN